MAGKIETIIANVQIEDILARYGVAVQSGRNIKCFAHADKTPSMAVRNGRVKCFACGYSGNVIDVVAFFENCDTARAIEKINEWYRLFEKGTVARKTFTQRSTEKAESERQRQERAEKAQQDEQRKAELIKAMQPKVKKYILDCQKNVHKTDFLRKRGLNAETIKRFCLGFDPNKNAVVIPYSSDLTYFQRRSVSEKRFYKPKSEYVGAEPVFNYKVLTAKCPVFVVESPICAMSVWQSGGAAIAIGGCGIRKLLMAIKDTHVELILSFDNDEAGKHSTEILSKELQSMGVKFSICNIADNEKDPNDLLKKDPSKLTLNIKKAIEAHKGR